MDNENDVGGGLSRTTIDPDVDTVEMGAWVPPIKCEGCDGRVEAFYRWNKNTEARCSGCGSEWEIESPLDQ